MINWMPLADQDQLTDLIRISHTQDCLIFKHSTSCSISAISKHRLEAGWAIDEQKILPYYLDLLSYRDVSNAVATTFGVHHESPQVLLIRDGRCVYHTSHLDISADALSSLV